MKRRACAELERDINSESPQPTVRDTKHDRQGMAGAAAAEDALPGKRLRLSQPHSASTGVSLTSIVWYRDFDLRTHDHQPLTQAALRGAVVPSFIWQAEHERGDLSLGGAAQVKTTLHAMQSQSHDNRLFNVPQAWLEESLESLSQSLQSLGSHLILRGGEQHTPGTAATSVRLDIASQLALLAEHSGATAVFYHRAYTPDGSREEENVSRALALRGIEAVGLAGHLL